MKSLAFLTGLLLLSSAILVHGTVYYVSPTGSDDNPGTLDLPFWSIQKAQELVSPGDTVYLRGGTYTITEADISKVQQNLFACITFLDKSGTAGARIKYWAYPGENPLFDLSTVTPANQRVVCIWVEGDYLHIRGLEITGVQVTITEHTESYCVYSWGDHNIFELLYMHDNQGTGLRHRRGGDNLFLNCDAGRNHDYTSEEGKGSNTDGFGCHPHDGGTGNVFRGCRAWFNSDDGYDVLGAAESVVFENCWAFYNGYSVSFESLGDGNGFKAGGYGSTPVQNLPDPIPPHTVRFCLAVRNKASGFYSNHHITGSTWYNNSAYRNSNNFNMLNRLSDNVTDVPGYGHLMRNNLAYRGTSIRNVNNEQCDISHNSFDLGLTLSDADFLSLDETLLVAPREADGSLPENDFMRLSKGSQALDQGEDIGYTWYGTAPELGCFEKDYLEFNRSGTVWYQYFFPEAYWEPGRAPRYLIHGLGDQDTVIGDLTYRKLFRFLDDRLDPENAVCVGGIRETGKRQIYFRNFIEEDYPVPDTGEILLYDFGVDVGDTVRFAHLVGTDYLVVSGTDAVSFDGEYRKRILFEAAPYSSWIVGMGSERGLLMPSGNLPYNGLWSDLTCYYQDGVRIYHKDSYEFCYEPPSGTETEISLPGEKLRLSPNPCSVDYLDISAPMALKEIRILDATGRVVLSRKAEAQSSLGIDLGGLEGRIYLIQATGIDGQVLMAKLLRIR